MCFGDSENPNHSMEAGCTGEDLVPTPVPLCNRSGEGCPRLRKAGLAYANAPLEAARARFSSLSAEQSKPVLDHMCPRRLGNACSIPGRIEHSTISTHHSLLHPRAWQFAFHN